MFRKFEIICAIRIYPVIFPAWILFLVIGLASPNSAFAEGSSPLIQIEPDCSQLEIQDAPLPAVAKALSRESGIQIRFLASLTEEFISAQLHAKDCSGAVLALLQEFNVIKFWNADGGLVAVQLLSRKQAWFPEAEPQESPLRMAEALDKHQVQTLIDAGRGILPPSEVMYSPVYEPYLHKAGLRELEDWKDKKKVKILRRHALRAWMQQRQASQSR